MRLAVRGRGGDAGERNHLTQEQREWGGGVRLFRLQDLGWTCLDLKRAGIFSQQQLFGQTWIGRSIS